MAAVVADTHAILWYLLNAADLSTTARDALRNASSSGERVYISTISVVEAIYLTERKRIPAHALLFLERALLDEGVALSEVPVDLSISMAVQRISRDVVPDMPDRIIAATALSLDLPLVTRDRRLRALSIPTIW